MLVFLSGSEPDSAKQRLKENTMENLPSLEEMLKAGMHFGHRTSKWHPKMAPYIFSSRNGVHILNLTKSKQLLKQALVVLEQAASEGKTILLVGSKTQVKTVLKESALACNMPYVNEGWLGGTITNFAIIRKAIRKYKDLLAERDGGKLDKYTKKERLQIDREINRLDKKVGGLVNLNKAPDIMFIWDIKEEKTALAEAKKCGITVVAVCDTNVNPQNVDYVIPANDDASKTISMILGLISVSIKQGVEHIGQKPQNK